MTGSHFRLEVTEALVAFRDALVALAPIADRVGIPWRDDRLTDDWDAVTRNLYAAVISNIADDPENWDADAAPLAPYDLELSTYEAFSWLELSTQGESGDRLAFVRLSSVSSPFDTAEFLTVAPDLSTARNVSMPLADVELVLRRQLKDGRSQVESAITFQV